ncbi:MAG: TetR/AcrR family transcriptional regulator [Parvularculaceae bacterium]
MKAKRPKKRKIGRPKDQESSVGRAGILDATCELLMQTPPISVTLAMVARHTQIDPALIRYYFKDRAGLLVAAAEQITNEYSAALADAMERCGDDPEERLKARIKTLVNIESTYPFFHQLFIDEVLNSNAPSARKLVEGLTERAASGYGAVLAAGNERGVFRDVDKNLLFVSTIAMCEFYNSAMELLGLLAGKSVRSEKVKGEYADFICDLIINGIKTQKPARSRKKKTRTR